MVWDLLLSFRFVTSKNMQLNPVFARNGKKHIGGTKTGAGAMRRSALEQISIIG